MFSSDKKIKISGELYEKLEKVAALQGCSNVEEYVAKILEEESDKVLAANAEPELSAAEVDDIAKKLQGLGYLE